VRPRILDTSAILALFDAHPHIMARMAAAEAGKTHLLLPTSAIAEAETRVRAGSDGWAAVLLTPGVVSLPLTEHAAIEGGEWPGDLATRHAVHEAQAVGAAIMTRYPGIYQGHHVALVVV
jgi:hypothetical protein